MPQFTPLNVRVNMDADPWVDLQDPPPEGGTLERVGILRHGTSGGRATVAVAIRLPDGRVVIGETTWRLWQLATRAMAAGPVGSEETDD